MLAPRTISAFVAAGLLVSACSTRPRNFAASVSTPVSDRTAFEANYRTCQALVRQGRKSDFKAAAASTAAAGVGTLGAGALLTSTGMAGVNIGTGAASASFAAIPVIGILAGFGVSRAIRGGNERKFKRGMSACLAEYGYAVDGWQKLKKRADAAQIAAQGVAAEPVVAPLPADAVTVASVDAGSQP